MKAGKQFVDDLGSKRITDNVTRVAVDVYGSLSLTGKASPYRYRHYYGPHEPATVDIDVVSPVLFATCRNARAFVTGPGDAEVDFPKDDGMRFHNGNLPLHEKRDADPRPA